MGIQILPVALCLQQCADSYEKGSGLVCDIIAVIDGRYMVTHDCLNSNDSGQAVPSIEIVFNEWRQYRDTSTGVLEVLSPFQTECNRLAVDASQI